MNWNNYSGFLLTYKQWLEIGIIIVTTFIITRVFKLLMRRFVSRSSDYLKIDKTRLKFMANSINGMIFVLAFIMIIHTIPALRSVSTTLFASAGILAAVIGFASQQAVSNVISGVFVVLFRPFRVGDNIKIGIDLIGTVEDITLRHTIIRDPENARIIIPNSIINSQTVINYDIIDSKFKKRIIFNVSSETPIEKASKIIRHEVFKHEEVLHENYTSADDISVEVTAITDRYVTLRVFVWAKNIDAATKLNFDVYKNILETFKQNNISLADPQNLISK